MRLPRHYFLYMAVLGIAAELCVSALVIGPSWVVALVNPLDPKNALAPVFAGTVTSLLTGATFDLTAQHRKASRIFRICIAPLVIFLTGALIGLLINLLLPAIFSPSTFGFANDIRSWFLRPALYVVPIGATCALVLGACYEGLRAWLTKRAKKI